MRLTLRSLLYAALAALLLLSVALFNGYPTVYPDTASYLYTGAFHRALPPYRAPVYSAFLIAASLGKSMWFIVMAQAVVAVTVLFKTCAFFSEGDAGFRDRCLLATAAALAAVTSLPWLASLLMPDVFAGAVFLALFLLAFDERLKIAERLILAGIVALGAASHLSLLPIGAVFAAALVVAKAAGWIGGEAPSGRAWVAWLAAPLLIAALWTASLNRGMGLGFKVSPSGPEFLLGRMFGDGLAEKFLQDNCPAEPFVACKYLNNLPRKSEDFLFWHPLLHEMQANGNEMERLTREIILTHPLRFAWLSAAHSLRQFAQLKTGDEVRDLALHAQNFNGEVIAQVFPRELRAYGASRLIRGRMIVPAKIAAIVDTAAFWLSLLGCIYFVRTRRDDKWNAFFYSAVAYLALNAAVCATLAGVYDRYQSRVAWLVPLCWCLGVCRSRQQSPEREQEQLSAVEVEI